VNPFPCPILRTPPILITWVHLLGENGPGLDALTDRLIGKRARLAFAPGTKSVYSNLGYLLLGQLVERLSGEGFAAYVEQHVLEPLGCQATAFVPAVGAAIGHQRRLSIMGLAARWMLDSRFFGETEGGYWTLRPFAVDGAPYGSLFGPMPDLLRLARAMLAGGRAEKGPILAEASVRSMLSPSRSLDGRELAVGLGWGYSEGFPDIASVLTGSTSMELRTVCRVRGADFGADVALSANPLQGHRGLEAQKGDRPR
jgi:D-alanyl-D-alanine carboxypeptidase